MENNFNLKTLKMDRRILSTILGCLFLVHATIAQECAVNQCPLGDTCYVRDVDGQLPYVCECSQPFTQGPECTVQADTQEVFTCYGDSCRSGSFNSVNYPAVYTNRYRALYLLYVPGAQSITFTFSPLFDIEEFKDELYVGSGLMYDDVQLDGLGNPPDWHFFEGSITPDPFTIQGDVVWMYFGTDKNIQRSGWELSWNALVDNEPPSFPNCPSNIDVTVEIGTPNAVVSWTVPTAVDMSATTTVASHTPGQPFTTGTTTTVVYTATDEFGNIGQCSFTITVTAVDTTPPTITVPMPIFTQDIEVGSASGAFVFFTEPTASDNSGNVFLISRSATPGSFFPVGTNIVTYVYRDAAGNNATATITVVVSEVDTTPPVVTVTNPFIARQVELGTTGINIIFPEPTATDNSGTVNLVSRTAVPGDFFTVGTTIVTYTFEDGSGNPATGTVTIIVTEVDTTPPAVTVPSPIINRLVELGTPGATVFYIEPFASDNSGTATLVGRTDQNGNNVQSGDFFPVGQTLVLYRFQDPSGNPATGVVTINVVEVDSTPPVVNIPDPVVTQQVELGTSGTNVFYTEPTATDNSGTALLVGRTSQPGNFFPVGQTNVTYTFQDPSGNPATGIVTINVVEVDTLPPTITVSGGNIVRTVELGLPGLTVDYTEPTATDNSGTAILISRDAQPGDFFPVGVTNVLYIFQDPTGNEARATFTVTIVPVDTTPPTVVCTSNIFQEVELGTTSVAVVFTEPTATDISGQANLLSRTAAPGDAFPVGTTTVTYLFTDGSGNDAEPCTFTVTVSSVDTSPPVVNCVSDIFQVIELGTPGVQVFYSEPTAFDISGQANLVTRTSSPGDTFPVGVTTVTYIFADNNGNAAEPCIFTITITTEDTTPPTVNCITDVARTVELGTPETAVFFTEPTAVDISGTASLLTRTAGPGDTFPVGTTPVTYIFTDGSSNTAQPCTFNVIISTVDTTPPTVTCTDNIVQTIELGQTSVIVNYVEPTATDISGTAFLVSRSSTPGDPFPIGTTTVTYRFSDASNNEALPCVFTITVGTVDTMTPMFTSCPTNIVRTVELGVPGTTVTWTVPTANDAAGIASIISNISPGFFFPTGETTTITYVATDNSGLTDNSCSFTVTVIAVDTTPPTVDCNSDIFRTVELGTPTLQVFYTEPTATDVSGQAILQSRTNVPGEDFPVGSTQVTYVFSDSSGNVAEDCTFTITVTAIDTTPPTVNCISDIVQVVELGTTSTPIFFVEPTASDVGQATLVSRSAQPGDSFPVGVTSVTYVFSDNTGNLADPCTFLVTINTIDTTPPTVTCVSDITRNVELGTTSVAIVYTEPTATDISGTAQLESRSHTPGQTFPVGTTVVVYRFTDASGNDAPICSFTVTVTAEDTTGPIVTNCPANIVESVELGIQGTIITYTAPSATDAAGIASIIPNIPSGSFFSVGETRQVTYTITDNSGLVDTTCTFSVTVFAVDTTPPTVTCTSDIIQTVELGTTSVAVFFPEPTATDVSGTANLVLRTNAPGDSFPVGQTTVTYRFSDNANNVAEDCTFTITVTTEDTTPPVVVCTPDQSVTVELGTTSVPVFYNEPTASDVSGQAVLLTRTAASGDNFPVGVTTVTYVFSDGDGNQADPCIFTVTVNTVDTTPPEVTCVDAIIRNVELGTSGLIIFYTEPTATDISGQALLASRSNAPGDTFPVGSTVVTYIFTDPSGNDAEACIFTVTVTTVDSTDPTVTDCPADIVQTVELGVTGAIVTFNAPTATDLSGIASIIPNVQSGSFFAVGMSQQITFTVTDNSGNTNEDCTFTVTVIPVDNTPPTVTCVADINEIVELGVPSLQINYAEPTATDISGTAALEGRSNMPGEFFPVGITVITYNFTDASGNAAPPCTFTITITAVDTTDPLVNCPSNPIIRTIELGETGVQIFYTEPTATDISGQVNLISQSASPGDTFPIGETTIVYIFADNSGNTADPCTLTVTVNTVDTTPPTVQCVENIIRNVELGTTSLVVFYTEPSATDISGQPLLESRTNAPGDTYPIGTTVVSYVFTDPSGNDADPCIFTITITTSDTTPPTVTDCPDNIAQSVELGITGAIITYTAPTAMDVSGIASIIADIPSGTFFNVGETRQVTYTVTDNSGLTDDSCTFTVTVFSVDTTPPDVACVMNVIQSVELGTQSVPITYTEPTATDISDVVILVSQSHSPGDLFPVGQTTVSYVFADGVGNQAEACTFTITVIADDTTHPTVICTNDVVRTIELGLTGVEVFYQEPTASDISGTEEIVSNTNNPGDFFPVGETTVTYFFADASGNVAPPCTFTVTVNTVDTTKPEVQNCPEDIAVTIELGTATVQVSWVEPTATDISGTATIQSQTRQPGDEFAASTTTTITYIFIDDSNNVADPCTFTVTVNTEDTTPPTVENCPADIIRTIEVNSATEVIITWSPPTATDTSGTQFVRSQTANVGDAFPVGSTTVTYIISDASGNDADPCSFNVIIITEDTTPPVILNCPSDITDTTPLNSGGKVITFTAPTAIDNSNLDPSVTTTNQPDTFFLTGETIVVYTFTDQAGNPSSCSFTITIIEVDTEKPVIQNCPTDITVETPLGTALTVVLWPALVVTDNSGQTSVQSESAVSGDSFPPGRTTVTIIYQDPSSNTAMCQFTVIIVEVDEIPPEILSCPSDLSVDVPIESPGTTVIWSTPLVTDNSGLAPTVTSSQIPGAFFLRGSTQVTYTFTDGSGNQVSCSFVVTILGVDEVPPTVTCPDNIVETILEGVENAYVTFDLPTVTDNNGATNLVSSTASSGDAFPVGSTVVTFTYADSNGNEASCSFTVTVITDTPCSPDPCFNGGACVVNSLTEYQCVCTECFTGTNCETQLNACDGNLCQNGAACMAYEGSCDSYYCECPACFTGIYCDVPVDACDNNRCQNGAACVVDADQCLTYTCQCPLCFTGEFCQTKVDACDNHQCQNGAACEPKGDLCTEYTCQCASGCHTGDLCDVVRDPCNPSPCLNNGVCNTLGNDCYSYMCECVGCFTGFNCEEPIPSPCDNNPCQNNGVCSVIAGVCSGYQCSCADGFSGVNCEQVEIVNTNPCNNFPCANGATCLSVDSTDYTCLCRPDFTGINCQQSIANFPGQDSCTSSPCLNNAMCINSYDSISGMNFYIPQYTCICDNGFTGVNCGSTNGDEPSLDVCSSTSQQNCENGGVCTNMYHSFTQGFDIHCNCPIGTKGHMCETPAVNPCASGPCENGGVCSPFNDYFTCDCPDGFFGVTCEVATGDTEPPVITDCPQDITRTITSGTSIAVTWTEPTASDAGTTTRLLRSHTPGSVFAIGDTAVTYIFTDNSANLAECEFFITVTLAESDNLPPVISDCPSTIVVQAIGGATTVEVTWTEPTATDETTADVRVTNNYAPGQSFPIGDTMVSYTFTDEAGNQNQCTFTVRVVVEVINQSPTITFCPVGPLLFSTEGADEVAVVFPVPTAVDDSGLVPTATSNYQPGQSLTVGTYTVTYTFTDNIGLTSDCTFNIQVVAGGDITAPTVTGCPENAITAIAPAGATGTSVTWTAPTATDETSIVTTASTFAPGAVFPIGTTTVTYTFTDQAGNEARCLFNVIVTGTTVNETPAPSNLVLVPATTTITATWTPPNGAFNSYQLTISGGGTISSESLPQGSTSYTATGLTPSTDYVFNLVAIGNAGSSNAISSSATTNPEQGTAPSAPSNLVLTPTENSIIVTFDPATGDVSGFSIGLGSNSNANDVTATLAPDATGYTFSNLNPSTLYFISLLAFNNFGSSQPVVQSATTSDVVPPASDIVITNCPVSLPAILPFGTYAYVTWDEPTATSTLGLDVTLVSGPPVTAGYYQVGTYSISYQWQDTNGVTANCDFNIYVTDGSDTTAPEITFCPSDITVQAASGETSAVVTWNAPTATDASEPITSSSNFSPGDSFDVGSALVVYNLIDAAGNFATCSFTVTVTGSGVVVDTQNPVLENCPTGVVTTANFGETTSVVTWSEPSATDNSGSVSLTVNTPSGSAFTVGTTTEIVYTATDPTGNFVTCSFSVIVLPGSDITPPVLSNCPVDQTLVAAANGQGAVATWADATATDNSGDVVSITTDIPSGTTFPLGATTVTITATDSSGNIDRCMFTITVVGTTDNVGPVTSNCPASQSLTTAVGGNSAIATWTEPSFTDPSGVASVTSNFQSGASFPVGATTVTYTATDTLGNTGECSFTITVTALTDNEGPVTSNCPSSQSLTTAVGGNSAIATWTEPTFTDPSGVASVTSNFQSGASFPVGATTVTYTAIDTFGNSGQCTFVISVIAGTDATRPTFLNCPSNIDTTVPFGTPSAVVTWTVPIAVDNSGIVTTTSTANSGDSFNVGATIVTYTATDPSGNVETCSFTVTVTEEPQVDVTPPVLFNCPTGITATADPGSSFAIVTWTPPTATDNISVPVVTSNFPSGSSFPVGSTTVVYTAVDAAGNPASCSFNVVVESGTSNAAPVVTFCPTNGQLYFTAPGATSVRVNFEPPTATDDSGSVTATSTNVPGDTFDIGSNSVTYVFSDAQGLTAQCTFSFEVMEGANPCSSNPCNANEQCFYIPTQFLCINTNNRRRREAEMLDLTDVCPCENGGLCLLDEATSSASCECPLGYEGPLCQINTLPASNVNIHSSYHDNEEIEALMEGNGALMWSVIICMAVMLVVVISLSGLLCYIIPRISMKPHRRSKIDEVPILH